MNLGVRAEYLFEVTEMELVPAAAAATEFVKNLLLISEENI